MLKHNITIAIRNIIKNWKYSLVNTGGLAIGLASFIFIILYIKDELSFDKFNENARRIYRVNRLYLAKDVPEDAATLSFPAGPALASQYPDLIENQVRFFNQFNKQWFFEYTNERNEVIGYNEKWFFLADSTVFDVFTYKLIEGEKQTALSRPNTIVISKSTADRYFRNESPIGKTMRVEEKLNFKVTGVFEDLPAQSHMKIDLLGSLTTFLQGEGKNVAKTWIWNPCWTYVLLRKGVSPDMLEAKLPEFYRNNYFDFPGQDIKLYLQALTDIHLKSKHVYEMRPNSNIIYVNILSIIAVIIILLACINFVNLATASSAGRAKEIGMKKVFGGMKSQLTIQFLGEAIIQSIIAVLFALIITEVLLPLFNDFTEKQITTEFLVKPSRILSFFGLAVVVGTLAGIYPAFFLSSFRPLHVLRGTLRSGAKSVKARKILVVVQFAISISLIIITLVIFSQLNFIRNVDLGFKKDQIIIFRRVGNLYGNYEAFKQELLKNKNITHVTGAEDILGVYHNTRAYQVEGLTPEQNLWFPAFLVDWDFVQTYGIQVVEGRAFDRKFPGDTINAVMINETMARNRGWSNKEAIGKKVKSSDGDEKVIGVFKDFYPMSLHYPVNNFILDMYKIPDLVVQIISVRFNSSNHKEIIEYIKEKWNDFNPSRPFDYQFLDAEIDALYKDDVKFGRFLLILTILGIIIACLGLIGLTSFLAEQRTREIGIRKVFGASPGNIIKLMYGEFIILLIIANLIAWPVAYLSSYNWLNNYPEHVSVSISIFLLACLITMLLALIISGIWTFKISSLNPAQTLKYE